MKLKNCVKSSAVKNYELMVYVKIFVKDDDSFY